MILDRPFGTIRPGRNGNGLCTLTKELSDMQTASESEESGRPRLGLNVCAIIPAYNESKTIADVIRRTRLYVPKIFVIDDCSTDDTGEISRRCGAEVIRHAVNGGPGAALRSGLQAARDAGYDFVVQVDADGQHDPKYIPEMLERGRDCDMVIASRFLNGSYRQYPFVRRLGVTFFSMAVRAATGQSITDVTSGFRLYRVDSVGRLTDLPDRHWAVAQTMEAAKKGLRIREISAEMPVRKEGKSQFSLVRYALYPFRMIPVMVKYGLFR